MSDSLQEPSLTLAAPYKPVFMYHLTLLKPSFQQFVLRVISGEARGIGPGLLRGLLRCIEPIYSAAVSLRNRKFDRGIGVKRLPRPVISVGNLTAGGTGKTPVVRWLCESLRKAGHQPAVLMRGYGAKTGHRGDEQAMLDAYLNSGSAAADAPHVSGPQVPVHANPSRFEGGTDVLRERTAIDVFVLDDGFQHRRLARDFDLVLIDATSPFGNGHVHPRGLLREPLRGIRRADAVLITRWDAVTETALGAIETRIRSLQTAVPIYHARHAHTGLRVTNGGITRPLPLAELAQRRCFVFCGIGQPDRFLDQLNRLPGVITGHRWFPDHHAYTADEIASISKQANAVDADLLLTTEKDWVKLAALAAAISLPVWRVELAIEFRENDEEQLLKQIGEKTGKADRH